FSAYGYGFHNYVILPTYEYPAYIYVPGDRDLVWLYLKDGTVYGVADYWFVNSEVHFITIEERGAKSTEEIAASDELDFEKTNSSEAAISSVDFAPRSSMVMKCTSL